MALHDDTDAEQVGYERPTIERLGTLADLTAGSSGDGFDFNLSVSFGGGIPGGPP